MFRKYTLPYSTEKNVSIKQNELGIGEAYSGFWWGNLRERGHLGDTGVDGRIILRWVFRKWDLGYGLDRAGSG